MIGYSKLFALMVVVCLGLGTAYVVNCAAELPPQTRVEDELKKLEQALKLIELKVKVPSEVKLGDPIVVEIELKNASDRDVSLAPSTDLGAFRIDVLRTNHYPVKKTALADEVFLSDKPSFGSGRNGIVPASTSLRYSQDISKMFELSPGSHGVLMSVGAWTFVDKPENIAAREVWSNIGELRVKPADLKKEESKSK